MSIDPKEARLRLGLNQTMMADAMSVNLRTWTKWERGEREPNAAAQQMMAALIWLKDKGQLDDFLESRAIIF